MVEENKKQITIIIPIHNRILFLPQVLEYYSRFGRDIKPKIIVADSSSADNFDENKKTINKYGALNIRHLSIHGAGRPLYDKIIDTLKYVETEFCVCCADDDFITIIGLKETVEFLKNNPDFIVAHGAYISFHTRAKGKKRKLFWRPAYFNHSVIADSAEERLTDQFLNFKAVLYAVYRTNELKYIFEEVKGALDSEVKIQLFGELLSSMLTAVRGKIKDLDVFYSARREDAPFQGQHIKWSHMRDYVRDGKFEAESVKFKECVAKNVLIKSDLNLEKVQVLVNDGLACFIKKGLPPDYFRHFILNVANILKDKNTPSWLYKFLKGIYRIFVPIRRGGSDGDLLNTNLAEYNDDFNTFKNVVLGGGA